MSGSKPGKATWKNVSGKGIRQLSGQAVRESRCPSKNHEREEDQKTETRGQHKVRGESGKKNETGRENRARPCLLNNVKGVKVVF